MSRFKKTLLGIVLTSITICLLFRINEVLEPKNTYRNSEWPTTSSYLQFYKMEKDSIDVLFLGSSYAETSFVPQVLYNEYGIRSYNLACEQQSIFLSYYWLKEALRFQSPKAVVLDCRFLFPQHMESPINTEPEIARICLDPMKWSAVKAEAVNEICKLDPSQSVQEWLLTNFTFHDRWEYLNEIDFSSDLYSQAALYGYAPIFDNMLTSYTPFTPSDPSIQESFDPLMHEYMDRIVQLCQDNHIDLILVSVPSNGMTDGINNALTNYAAENSIEYINFSTVSNYSEINAVFPSESAVDHENVFGAAKTSSYIGRILSEQYDIPSVEDEQWQKQNSFYDQILNDEALVQCTDFDDYLDLLRKGKYTILMAVNDDMVGALTDEDILGLNNLGIRQDFTGRYFMSWCTSIASGKVKESGSDESVSVKGMTDDGLSTYSITSKGRYAGRKCSITIDETSYEIGMQGLNIVVYDDLLGKPVDSVVFNLATDRKAYRSLE